MAVSWLAAYWLRFNFEIPAEFSAAMWAALPIVCELFGVADPDLLIHQLVAIRDSQRESE